MKVESRESRVKFAAGRLRNTFVLGAMFTLGFLAGCANSPPTPIVDRSAPPIAAAPATPTITAKSPPPVLKRGGGFYQDDGPGDNAPENMAAIPDAIPKVESLHKFANNPYSVLGHDYVPMRELGAYKARGLASWYGRKFHGQKTSSGEPYDMYGMTAAHATLPIPSYVRVSNPANGKSVIVRVNDRGPFHVDRIIDLSYTAAWKLDLVGNGSGLVEVESVLPGQTIAHSPPPSALPNSPKTETLPEVSDAHGTWLQLGAFSSRENADALKSRLEKQLGTLGEKLVVQVAGKYFRLQLGPWSSVEETRQAAASVAETLGMTPVVVQR
jgi:rare lipoprotein A